jgi:hypothetical protein
VVSCRPQAKIINRVVDEVCKCLRSVIPLKFLCKRRIFFSCELNPGIYCTYIYSVETLTGIKFITWTLVIFVKNLKKNSRNGLSILEKINSARAAAI